MASLPVFTDKDSTTYTFPKARFLPVNEPIRPNQLVGKAGGGQIKITDLGTAERTFPIVLLRVSATARNNLISWFQDPSVNYKQFAFTFTDEDSNNYTVRLDSDVLDFPHAKGDLYNIRFTLREEIST